MTVEDFLIKKDETKSKNCQNYFLDCVSDFKCKLRRLFIKLNFFLYPLASKASEPSKLALQARRYKFYPIPSLPPIHKKQKN
jgi:hypothetical protein